MNLSLLNVISLYDRIYIYIHVVTDRLTIIIAKKNRLKLKLFFLRENNRIHTVYPVGASIGLIRCGIRLQIRTH